MTKCKFKLNFISVFEVVSHLLFWLLIIWLKNQNKIFFIASQSEIINVNGSELTHFIPVLTFYWFYLFLIPRLMNRSQVLFLSVSLISLISISEINSFISVFTNAKISFFKFDIIYWFNFVVHLLFAISALVIKQLFSKLKHSWSVKEQEVDHTKTELALLKQQIHPHFLFNVLNSLFSSSYHYGDEKTAEGIGQLSDLLRYMLYETGSERVPIKNELDYLNDYIKLQMLRFSDDVDLEFSCDGELSDIEIAPMMLITLVENAFKHGVFPQRKNSIKINLKIEQKNIIFTVSNAYQQIISEGKQIGGLGLTNLKKRLMLIYKNKHQFTTSINNKVFTAELLLR